MASLEVARRHPLVGRVDELAQLESVLGLGEPAAASGGVLLAGDAGVGKSTVLRELGRRAQAAGWRVLVGHCLDFGDGTPPYLPFSEALGRLVADEPALGEALLEANPAVSRLLPGRRQRTGGDDADDSPTGVMERSRLFEHVHAALEQLARESSVLLVVEDVHWADSSTRELLSYLFTRGTTGPVVVVASYRTDDLHRRHPLRTVAAEWSRLPGVRRLPLGPLPDAEIRALVRALHPEPLPEHDVRAIVDRAEGNAFFAEELVAACGDEHLPDDLAELLLVRLERLDEAARSVVRAVSVAGRRVPHALLAQVVDLPPDGLDAALRTAVERHALVASGADAYAFRHALLAEAVYDDLLPGERVRLHAAYAKAIGSGDLPGTAAELAHHARLAGDVLTALTASIEAGDEAMRVGGPDEAARHYETALELGADHLEPTVGVDVVDLAVRAGDAISAAGRPHRALKLLRAQLAELPDSTPAERRAVLLQATALAALHSDGPADMVDLTREALELVPERPPSPLRTRLTSMHARVLMDRWRDDEARRWARDALDLAQEQGLADVRAEAITTLAGLERRGGDPTASRDAYEQAAADARRAGATIAELRSLYMLGSLEFELGRLAEAQRAYEATSARAREAGRPWGPYGVDARVMAAAVAFVAGDFAGVERLVDVTDESPPALGEAALAAMGLSVAAARGDRSAIPLLDRLRPWWRKDGLIALISAAAAIDLHGDAGDLEAATAAHDDVVDEITRSWGYDLFQARIKLGALLLGHLVTRAARASSAERPALLARGDALLDVAQRVVASEDERERTVGPESHAWLHRIAAEHARLQWVAGAQPPDEATLVSRWRTAVDGFERFGHVFELARSRARLAAVLRATGDTAGAEVQRALAVEAARRLRAAPLLSELRELGVPAGNGHQRLGEELTAREREVLALVADGRSNREIGQRLFISTKTASVHVSNILAKLGAGGRTEAAAVARRRGLLGD